MFLSKIKATIDKYSLLEVGDRVLVAVSGGPDSIALLYALYSLREKYQLMLRVAHLNHLIHPERAREQAKFVQDMACNLHLPYTIEAIDVPSYRREKGLSVQAAAREVRYQFLTSTAQQLGFNRVALGHTADDQAETIIMRLLRGAGPRGLSGIPPVRRNNSIHYIRPLLETSRQEIEDFLIQQQIKYLTDPSNLQPIYLRNKIRLELLPIIRDKYNPNIVNTLIRLAEILRQEDSFLEDLSSSFFRNLVIESNENGIILDKAKLLSIPATMQRRVLRHGIKEIQGVPYSPFATHTFSLIKLIARTKPEPAYLNLPGGVKLISEKDRVLILKKEPSSFLPLPERELKIPGRNSLPEYDLDITITIKSKADIRLSEAQKDPFLAVLDYQKIHLPLRIRTRKRGDRFSPLGLGGSKKLKEFFIDRKIPRIKRDRTPLLISGEDILWIIGVEISDRAKITTDTTTVIEIVARKDNQNKSLLLNKGGNLGQ
jgi:tRNA(Ile)-lysidine synthase